MRPDPERSCVGCRTRRSKGELVRVARRPDGQVVVDPDGTAPGRGAYVCRDDPSCLGLAIRKGAFGRALRLPLGPEDLATLQQNLNEEIEAT
jgi:uncharacterized protein